MYTASSYSHKRPADTSDTQLAYTHTQTQSEYNLFAPLHWSVVYAHVRTHTIAADSTMQGALYTFRRRSTVNVSSLSHAHTEYDFASHSRARYLPCSALSLRRSVHAVRIFYKGKHTAQNISDAREARHLLQNSTSTS